MPANSPQDVSPSAQLVQMFFESFLLSRAIWVAAHLNIADLLAVNTRTADELAQATGVHAPSLYRVLRALASSGIFAEDETRRFHLTPLAEPLRSDVPDSWHAFAKLIGSDWMYGAYGDILYSVQTGQPAFDHVYGKSLSEYLAENPDQARLHNEGMTNTSQASAPAVLAAYDFSGITKLVDVGGGHGFLLASILKAYPQMRGVLFDLPAVVAGAAPILEAHGVSERCECIGGDFFTAIPRDGDAYILQGILYGMADEYALRLLHNIRQSMRENGILLQIDIVVPEGNVPSTSKFSNLNMMLYTPNRDRTAAEHRALYERVGFQVTRVLPTSWIYGIVEGRQI